MYKFSNYDKNRFILLLWRGVYPYEYMDDWQKFSETSLPEKENFDSHLNMEDVTAEDYKHAKKVWKDFEIKTLENVMNCVSKGIHCCYLMYLRTFEI